MIEQITKELQEGASIGEMCKKYDLSFSDLVKLSKIRSKIPISKKPLSYITKRGNRWVVVKSINQKLHYFGAFYTEKEAVEVRDKLIDNDWELPASECMGVLYIQKKDKGWVISKRIGDENQHIGRFRTLEEAQKVRDGLVRFDWDLDYLDLICRQVGAVRIGG